MMGYGKTNIILEARPHPYFTAPTALHRRVVDSPPPMHADIKLSGGANTEYCDADTWAINS